MIAFDAGKLSISIVQLKTITTSFGGSITVIDEKLSTVDKEVYKRIAAPMSICRDFIQRTKKITRYLKPTLTAVVFYDNLVVALERHPLSSLGTIESEGVFGTKRWIPNCEKNIEKYIEPLTYSKDWYFDGRYMYSFDNTDLKTVIKNGQPMTRDLHFVKVNANTVDLQDLFMTDEITKGERSCIAFTSDRGDFVISPPIWKDLSGIGTTQLKKSATSEIDDDDDEMVKQTSSSEYSFDKIDHNLSVNLNFALKAGNEIGHVFGYQCVEPLCLPQLMVDLHTTNLPNIPNVVKSTYDIGINFTHALAWTLGFLRKANKLETYLIVRSLLKYLTKRGIYRNNTFEAEHVFKEQKTVADVPLIKMEDHFEPTLWSGVFDQIITVMKRNKTTSEVKSVGLLQTED